ncbi:malate synthase [Microbacterium ginsengiterrae]|uniref:Malate synthase G n=1 Tax=Microbacterium ginsengiterrae TaxID=546115 RepID=A0A7W9CBH7_9MICO|nr:malate synthase G [Microbacterium ginsengiterrae]MBB5742564.1 malate synthase [Microbacterium ginsengiterrae]
MSGRIRVEGLDIAAPLFDFVTESLPGTGIDADAFWRGVRAIIEDLSERNRTLIARRVELQAQIDAYHRSSPGQPEPAHYRKFLEEIGYLVPEPAEFEVSTPDVDREIAEMAGPQLVVPLLNARFAVNAVNARWGSLYDALYGTDAVSEQGELQRGARYNAARGAEVIRIGHEFLDRTVPLLSSSHAAVDGYLVRDGAVVARSGDARDGLEDVAQFVGFRGAAEAPESLFFVHHGLHVEVVIDGSHPVGRTHPAGVRDIVLESAVTTIMDLEDSVAAVDVHDKVLGYRNWRDLMRGTLTAEVTKAGRTFTRAVNPDRECTAPDGGMVHLPGRSLLLVRNVGHLMTTDAVIDAHGAPVPEGILDAVMTTLGALEDLRDDGRARNSRTRSLYIVKPKMHGPEEVALSVELFRSVEELFGLPENTIKIGIMDEERRTSLNLRACLWEARSRVAFINTGFLDRTGDDIHTSMCAGPVVPKSRMKEQPFMRAYEKSNVQAGLRAGMSGRAQIGKGMWAMPDLMMDMLEQKSAHVRSGATTAWVPSPTAATLHALHYHELDAHEIQARLRSADRIDRSEMLILPLAEAPLSAEAVATELDNNVQSILGYVVRWVDQGVGCSKVPDIHGVALMEDRATLRISSQLLANWLLHGVISADDVEASMRRLSAVVDRQNVGDPSYEPLLGAEGGGLAFEAARRLILEGAAQPNGYTEPILHEMRRRKKEEAG